MESSSDEVSKEETKLSSVDIAEENCEDNGKIPEGEANSINSDSQTKETNDNSNSPTLSSPFTGHTCPKRNGNVPPNGQALEFGDSVESQSTDERNPQRPCPKNDRCLTENSDSNLDVDKKTQVIKLKEKSGDDNISLNIISERESEETSDLDNYNKSTPDVTEFVPDSSVNPNQPNVNLFSDSDSSSKGSNKIPSLILKRWEDSPSDSVWYNLKPCLVVLQRCDLNENYLSSNSLSCNSAAEELDTISVISDMEDVGNFSGAKPKPGKLRYRKPHSESSKNNIKRSSFNKCVKPTSKSTRKLKKNNAKVFKNRANKLKDSDLDNNEPNCNNIKTIEVSAQVHKPPEHDEDSDAIAFNTTTQTSSVNCRTNVDITVEMDLNTSTEPERIGKRKRNSSSISSMSFSEILSDENCVGSNRRIIKPSAFQQPSRPINKKTNSVESTCEIDASDNPQLYYQSSENGIVEILQDDNLYVGAYEPDTSVSTLILKQCQVVLSRCDDQIDLDSSNVLDENSRNQIISNTKKNCYSSNPNRIYSDSFLSDTDEVMSPSKQISPKMKKKQGLTKKKRFDLYRSTKIQTQKKSMNKKDFTKEILNLKNTMERVEKKIDKLIDLHLQLLDSD